MLNENKLFISSENYPVVTTEQLFSLGLAGELTLKDSEDFEREQEKRRESESF